MKVLPAAVAGLVVAVTLTWLSIVNVGAFFAADLITLRAFGQRWLDSGSMYLPLQVSGPYSVWSTSAPDLVSAPSLYPPAAGPVFGLLAILPWPVAVAAWWAIPLGIMAWALYLWRPQPWVWALLLIPFLAPNLTLQFVVGGTSMWAMALITLGLLYHWPAALILLKPTLAPLALVGMRDWRWWAIVAGLVVVTFMGPWTDYLAAVRNGTDSGGLVYSLWQYPLLVLPLIAYLGRSRGRHARLRVPVAGVPLGGRDGSRAG